MENATKALLIAAAVLIVILVIALGMRIFNSTSDTTGQASAMGEILSNSTNDSTSSVRDSLLKSDLAQYIGTNFAVGTGIRVSKEDGLKIYDIFKNYGFSIGGVSLNTLKSYNTWKVYIYTSTGNVSGIITGVVMTP